MASVTLNIQKGTPPYTISVVAVEEEIDRFLSYSGSTLSFLSSDKEGDVTYVVTVTDALECQKSVGFTLNCQEPENPDFLYEIVQPLCLEGGTYEPAKLLLTDIKNATRFKICYNTLNFDCAACTDYDDIIDTTSKVIPLSTPTTPTSRFFIMRVYNVNCNKYKEISGTIITPSCVVPCTISMTLGTPLCN